MHPIIALWSHPRVPSAGPIRGSHPRSMSTALESVMRERGDLACFHEPFMGDHYVHRAVRTMPLYDVDPSQPAAYEAAEEEETYDEESSGAIGIGVRSGNGQLHRKAGGFRKVYWQGPSIAFDLGANASKVFVLIYHLPSSDALFQRFPAVDGSFYLVAGVGAN